MPKPSLYTLLWSEDEQRYELFAHGQLQHTFQQVDEPAWFAWLNEQQSFAFQGRNGHLSVIKEVRSRGTAYWYAYRRRERQTYKRYLGQTATLTFSRLEEVALVLTPLHHQSVSQAIQEELPVLVSKLSRPSLSASLIERERLQRSLDGVMDHQLTLISASAGWGKTTLLSMWAARSSCSLAWLTVDAQDDQLTRFWRSLIAALQCCRAEIGKAALALLCSPQPFQVSVLLTILLNDLHTFVEPMVLVLDDYHVIEEAAIHDSLLFFLDHLPGHFHLVIASRIDPPLALARRRVRGQVFEIRDTDLRFREDETSRFFRESMGLALTDDEVSRLEVRTEGWIAGLQLAALAMQRHKNRTSFVHAFTGSHRYLLDYIQEEILARLPATLQTFLLQTAILKRMTATLCEAVTTEPASQHMLETIEQANLFLVSLDDERQWYRYHDLFRETLFVRLQATQPELVWQLYGRAARWYEEQKDVREAIAYGLAAKDFSYAASLMEQAVEMIWLNGEVHLLYRWIMALPDAEVNTHAALVLTATLYLLNTGFSSVSEQRVKIQDQAEKMITRVEKQIVKDVNNEQMHQRLRLLHLWMQVLKNQGELGYDQVNSIYEQMKCLNKEDEILWQMIPLSIAFLWHHTFLRDVASLIPLLLAAKQQALQSDSVNIYATIKIMQWLALSYSSSGQLYQAYREVQVALELIQQRDGYAILTGYFYTVLVDILYQWNQLEEARNIVEKKLHDAQVWQQIDLQITGYISLMEIDLCEEKYSSAKQYLQKMETLIQQQGLSIHSSWLPSFQVRYWLATGDLNSATHWAAHTTFDEHELVPNQKDALLMLVRIYLVQHQPMQALDILERFRLQLDQPGSMYLLTNFLVVLALVLFQVGKQERLYQVMLRLLRLTEPGGYLRVYLDEGEWMEKILQSILETSKREKSMPHSYILRLLDAFAQENEKRRSVQIPQVQKKALIEPLTPREKEVLRYVVEGASNQEISARLVITLATVKKHVSSLLLKLAAENRTHAVVRARELSLF